MSCVTNLHVCICFVLALTTGCCLCEIRQSMVPQLAAKGSQAAKSKSTTTISHTFAEYNTVITIYVIGPVSLLFLFRVNRTLRDHTLSQYKRKIVLIMLLAVQYTTLVVVRYDTIKGKTHYLFTGLTFFLLLLYHGLVSNAIQHPFVDWLKPSLGVCSVFCMSVFAGLVFFFHDIKQNDYFWTLCCFMEILALLSLGALDILDIYLLGLSLEQ